jgi:hypothetical protein
MATLGEVMASFAAVKTSLDLFRTTIDLLKDINTGIPAVQNNEAVARALTEAEKAVAVAEAQIGQAFGYDLCRKHFPPRVMLEVGHFFSRDDGQRLSVFECPDCGQIHSPSTDWQRTSPAIQ